MILFYIYDSFGQLIRENNKSLDKTFVYEYNEIGNITAAKTYAYTTGDIGNLAPESTDTYSYDTTHKDRLSAFNGSQISYNTTGCPSSYQGVAWSWKNGRLDTISNGAFANGKSYSFTYDGYGRLKQKKYNYFPGLGVLKDYLSKKTTTYTYDTNGRLVYEYKLLQYSDNTNTYRKFTYLYDESGIVGVVYNNNGEEQTYHYNRNIKGDVIGIFDSSGAEIVKYSYDSWGNFEITTGSLTNIAKDNPILYRGYYYDHDTELYLLDARFYNPKWRRFISPDDTAYLDPETPNGLNLYAYCNNDPVNYSDPSGHSAFLIAMSILAVSGLITTGIGLATDNNLVTAIGLTAVAVPALISGGLAISLLTPVGLGVGITTTVAGAGTALFASAEYQEAFTHNNWMLDAGMSEGWYNGLMLTTAIIATLGTMASSVAYSLNMNTITEVGRIKGVRAKDGYPGIRFTDKSGAIRSLEFHSAHQSHGVHLQLNNWWLNKQGYVGQYYRAFSKHLEIFKFWKGWF